MATCLLVEANMEAYLVRVLSMVFEPCTHSPNPTIVLSFNFSANCLNPDFSFSSIEFALIHLVNRAVSMFCAKMPIDKAVARINVIGVFIVFLVLVLLLVSPLCCVQAVVPSVLDSQHN